GQRTEIVRIDELEQMLREARELGLELQLHARSEERESLEEPLDIRVRDLRRAVDAEAAGDLRILLGELRAHLAKVVQLALVVAQKARIHSAHRSVQTYSAAASVHRSDLPFRQDRIAGLEIHLGLQIQRLRGRLRPDLSLDAKHER